MAEEATGAEILPPRPRPLPASPFFAADTPSLGEVDVLEERGSVRRPPSHLTPPPPPPLLLLLLPLLGLALALADPWHPSPAQPLSAVLPGIEVGLVL